MKRKRQKWLALGTISEATLRPEDLIPKYVDALSNVRLTRQERSMVRAFNVDRAKFNDDEYDLALTDLSTMLDNYVPPFTRFGSHKGDGACIGVWVDDEYIEHADSGELIVSDEFPVGKTADYWLFVNDHGNRTLYERRGKRWVEIWSVV